MMRSRTTLVFGFALIMGCASSPSPEKAVPSEAPQTNLATLSDLDTLRDALIGVWRYDMSMDTTRDASEHVSIEYVDHMRRSGTKALTRSGQITFDEDGTAREIMTVQTHVAIFEISPMLEAIRLDYGLEKDATFGLTLDQVFDYTWSLEQVDGQVILVLTSVGRDLVTRDIVINKESAEEVLRAAPLTQGQTQQERDAQTRSFLLGLAEGQQNLAAESVRGEVQRLGIEKMTGPQLVLDHESFTIDYERGAASIPAAFELASMYTSADLAGVWRYERMNDAQGKQLSGSIPSSVDELESGVAMVKGTLRLDEDGTGVEREEIWSASVQHTPMPGSGFETCPLEYPVRFTVGMTITSEFTWDSRRESSKRLLDTSLLRSTTDIHTLLIEGKSPQETFLEAPLTGSDTREQRLECVKVMEQHLVKNTQEYPEPFTLHREILEYSEETMRLQDAMRRLDMVRSARDEQGH